MWPQFSWSNGKHKSMKGACFEMKLSDVYGLHRQGGAVALGLLLAFVIWTSHAGANVVHIQYGGMSSSLWEQPIIDRFNELYEGRIHVTGTPMGENDLLVAIAGGAAPSVGLVDRFRIGSFAASGFLMPLDVLIQRDRIRVEDFFAPVWQETVYNGQIYGMPRNTDTRALWYNKTLFEEAGLDSNAPPRTWEDLAAYSSKLTRSDGERLVQVGFAPHWGNFYFPGWLWVAGGDLLDDSYQSVTWDSAFGRQTLQWMQEWIHTYGLWELNTFEAEFGTNIRSGRLGMEMNTPSRIETLADYPQWEWGTAYPPRPAGLEETPISWSGGHALVIPQGAPHVEEAWEFIKFFTSHEGQILVGQAAPRMPVLASAATAPEFHEVSPHLRTFVELMPHSRFRPVIPVASELYEVYRRDITSMLLANMPVDTILIETARIGQQILDDGWSRTQE